MLVVMIDVVKMWFVLVLLVINAGLFSLMKGLMMAFGNIFVALEFISVIYG